MTEARLGITVDSTKVEAATDALNRLAEAANAAREALLDLGIMLTADVMIDDAPESGEIN